MIRLPRNIRLGLLTAVILLFFWLPVPGHALHPFSDALAAADDDSDTPAPAHHRHSKSHKKKHSHARKQSLRAPHRHVIGGSHPFAALVVDADSGHILYEVNADAPRHPASLTKMMTLYLLFEALHKDDVSMDTLMPASITASAQQPTNIDLMPGDRITVKTAIESIVVRSANDSAVVVAEAIGGSIEKFASMMNRKAAQLGMTGTHFYNPNGLPDDRQVTTAYDMARLGIALRRDFPQYYHYFSLQEFTYRGQLYEGHNHLLGRYPGADGIKTGFIGNSGFNLVTSVKRSGLHLVGVIMGGRTAASRDQQMMDMLDNTFSGLAKSGRRTSRPDGDDNPG